MGDNRIVPVIMFHSVGLDKTDWVFHHISLGNKNFEDKMLYLRKAGYHFIFWSDLYEYMSGSKDIDLPAVMITFDDGYLDNWVFVYPILKKIGAKATIFVNPEFVDPSPKLRPNLDDVWSGKVSSDEINPSGFLNWEEMRTMERSGIIDIQSHSLTHTWYFSSPKIIDFHQPNDNRYPWLAWNLHPDQKPFYMLNDQSDLIPLGTPIYEYEKALICRRYFPPKKIEEEISDYVIKNGGKRYFEKDRWRKELGEFHSGLMTKYSSFSRFETEEEYQARVFKELKTSKQILEENLDKTINFICWPGGGYNEHVVSLALKSGYRSWTLSSRDQSNFRNIPGADPQKIKRIGSADKLIFKNKEIGYTSVIQFLSYVKRHQGSLFYKYFGRLLKAMHIIFSLSY